MEKTLGVHGWDSIANICLWSFLSIYIYLIKFIPKGLIEPNDIKQGYLGDCYFLSALSALSENYPEAIRRLFVTPEFQGLGLYCVYINLQGHWT